ncbi:YlmC/YmxH family sporulation protein [Allobacillus sp. GCM10007491]|uniref:YlmC/YmxH family sporulation protein n=1 Tax=Allobacillus saliphilus TaxID=2912308 RepID=A0A941HT52_9BACI|nr:YlmC/YmxH family sporulation protein [Allobacillus saliphilus]MBR7552939.1 YlmC/YmxH family sporulation protein [Allobacillus saliphilus]
MRFRELSGKELIDADNGTRLGVLGQTDLNINPVDGMVEEIVIQDYNMLGLRKGETGTTIRWTDLEVIGDDLIVIKRKTKYREK